MEKRKLHEKRIHLSPRLALIARLAKGTKTVADIGCDHGRLSVALLQQNCAQHVVASDVSAASVLKAEALRIHCGISDSAMEVVQADGLSALAERDVDCIIMAGLGGITMVELLMREAEIASRVNRFILQPMRGIRELRKYLYENHYCVQQDLFVEDAGRIYQVLAVSPGRKDEMPELWPNDMFDVGWHAALQGDVLLPRYLARIRAAYMRELERAQEKGASAPQRVLNAIEEIDAVLVFAARNGKGQEDENAAL